MRFGKSSWTNQDDANLKKAVRDRVSINRLKTRFKRSESGIRNRARMLGLEIAQVQRLPRADRQ